MEDNLGPALSLYGASTRIGELPDPKSRTTEAEVKDFIAFAKKLPSKDAYASAKQALSAYLSSCKLEPLGDPIYNEAAK